MANSAVESIHLWVFHSAGREDPITIISRFHSRLSWRRDGERQDRHDGAEPFSEQGRAVAGLARNGVEPPFCLTGPCRVGRALISCQLLEPLAMCRENSERRRIHESILQYQGFVMAADPFKAALQLARWRPRMVCQHGLTRNLNGRVGRTPVPQF